MFGYVRPFKPYMRMFEYDIYKAVYCGLCKDMGRRYGFVTRFTLSYDFAFLSLMDLSVRGVKLDAEKQRCIAHPLKKTMCAKCTCNLKYTSSAAVILTYHKLRDDIADKGLKGKLAAFALLPFFKKPYKKAARLYPDLAPAVENAMELQNKIEREKTAGIDLACEPTALMMQAVAGGLTSKHDQRRPLLERFGYLLGRFIYICDALDDLPDDHGSESYNPLLAKFPTTEGINADYLKKVHAFCDDSINFTLGEMADIYVKLDLKRYRDILDNIVYLGLKNVYTQIRSGKFRNNRKGNNDQ